MNYEYKNDDDGDLICCDSCQSEAPLHEFATMEDERIKRNLCEICAETLIGNATEYPEVYSNIKQLAVIIAQVGNIILKRIEERENAKTERES